MDKKKSDLKGQGNMEEYVSISMEEVIDVIKRHIILIFLFMVLGGLVVGIYTVETKEVMYESNGKLVVSKESAKIFYEDSYTQSDIVMYEKITNTYVEIAKSNTVYNKVMSAVSGYTKEELMDMISIKSITDTLILELNVKGENPADVFTIAKTYLNAIKEQCDTILPVGTLEILDEAFYPDKDIPPNIVKSILFGALSGVIIAGVVILIKVWMDSSKISTTNQITEFLGNDVRVIMF